MPLKHVPTVRLGRSEQVSGLFTSRSRDSRDSGIDLDDSVSGLFTFRSRDSRDSEIDDSSNDSASTELTAR